MADYGLRGRVAMITGVNNPQGIGAAAILFLSGEKARMLTGQVIKVSGGHSL